MIGGITSGIRETVSGVADSIGADFREVLAFNPASIPFTFPPQVQMGLEVANQIDSQLGLGLNIPTQQELTQFATGKLNGVLGSLSNPFTGITGDIEGTLQSALGKISDLDIPELDGLNLDGVTKELLSISWLF